MLQLCLVCRVTSLYSDGSCPLHQNACAEGEQASGLQNCALMASQGEAVCLTQMVIVNARARGHSALHELLLFVYKKPSALHELLLFVYQQGLRHQSSP